MTIILWLVGLFLAVIWLGVVFVGPPYVPALRRDVKALFDTLDIKEGDHVVDLGAGDGHVLVMAAERGARASGVEINPILAGFSWWRVRRYKGSVTLGNLWKYRLPDDTTHVFAFSAEVFMNKLEKYCVQQREHTDGFWLMCYGFQFKGRKPEKVVGAFNLYRF